MSGSAPDPALRRALLAARDKRERRGATGDGLIVVGELQPEEALALDGLLSPRRPILARGTLRIVLSQFEAALRSCGIEPRAAYEHVGGRPLRDLPAERLAQRELRGEFHSWLRAHEVVRTHPALAEWLERAARQGRVRAEMRTLVEQALRIVGALPPREPVQRTVLAARMLSDDPHGLDVDTPLHGLTISLLQAAAGLATDTPPREVWSTWGVLVDPVSSNVAALNLPLRGDTKLAACARTMCGTHMIITYGQLVGEPLRWPAGVDCFSCENPSILVAAERALGERCPPLLCTGGRPSDAARMLLSTVHAAGGQIRHHGDFDQAGVQILRDLEDRYAAAPWRFDIESLCKEPTTDSYDSLAPRPQTLESAIERLARSLPEELVIDELVSDLRVAGSPRSMPAT